MKQGYFTNKDGNFARPNLGASNKIVSVAILDKTIPLNQICILYNDRIIKEMTDNGYKFVDVINTGEIDYKELLKKYIQHIVNCEGIDFLDHFGQVIFTDDERKILNDISKDLEIL
jgi:hypothetical protein